VLVAEADHDNETLAFPAFALIVLGAAGTAILLGFALTWTELPLSPAEFTAEIT
jgi:hypothetical protein